MFSKSVRVSLDPITPLIRVPFQKILNGFLQAKFQPQECREVLESLIEEDPSLRKYFDLEAFQSGGFVGTEALRFPATPDRFNLSFTLIGSDTGGFSSELSAPMLKPISSLVRWGSRTEETEQVKAKFEKIEPRIAERLVRPMKFTPKPWPAITQPGIYRREHASLVIRSETTSILIDPIPMQTLMRNIFQLPDQVDVPDLKSIMITHGHGDHWDLSSILHQLEEIETPIYVPEVQKINLLTPFDFSEILSAAGLNGKVAAWDTTFTVGDIEIDVLPFYGEQPTREGLGDDPGLRSYGNCYRFNTPGFSIIVLVDSGADPTGNMVDAVRRSVEKRGPVDLVTSCLREFLSPFFGGLEHYWAALPFSRLQELYEQYSQGKLPLTTAGAEGVAELCAAAQVRYYVPYANGFDGIGTPILDVGWGSHEGSEAEYVAKVRSALKKQNAATQIIEWNVGDRIEATTNGFKVTPYTELMGALPENPANT